MANSFLSPTIITNEALRVLHSNLNFIGNINKQYDPSFANAGASPSGKIGPSLTIRMPNRATVRTGMTFTNQDVQEASQVVTMSTVKGVDWTVNQQDLTLTIDKFSERYIKPFVARLATDVEADALSMYKDVYNLIDNDTLAFSTTSLLQGSQRLFETLTPEDGSWIATLNGLHSTKLVDALKGQFNPQADMAENFRKGKIANQTLGFDMYRNSLLTPHQTGTAAKTSGYQINGANQTGSTLVIGTGTTTFNKGDVITIAGVNAVHPETKTDLGYLQNFVVTATTGTSATSLSVSPAIVTSGALQTVTASPATTAAIVKVGAGASETLQQSLAFHPDAFTFVSADLVNPSAYGAKGATQVMDGISMTFAQQYSISDGSIKCRLDVLYGYKTIRPELAVRIHADG